MDPHSPNKLFATKYCFLILGDEFLFLNHFFIFRFFFLFYVILLLLIFTKTMLLLSFYLINFFFMKITFIFSCSGMFRDVPACYGMFHVPGFIDAPNLTSLKLTSCRITSNTIGHVPDLKRSVSSDLNSNFMR